MNILDIESLKKYDDGRLLNLAKIHNGDGSVTFKACMNIYPYTYREIEHDTFTEWLQFCHDGVCLEHHPNYTNYQAKDWWDE